MKYTKKFILLCLLALSISQTSHSAEDESLRPLSLCRQMADGLLRIIIDPEDIINTPDLGYATETIHIINIGEGIEIERISENLVRIGESFLYVNDENRVLEQVYSRGIPLQNFIRLLFAA